MKNPLEYIPNEIRISRAKSKGEKEFRKYIRNTSSNYIKRKEVREFVFTKDNNKCTQCGSEENLQVDHIESVYRKGIEANIISNLQTLCKRCNSVKRV